MLALRRKWFTPSTPAHDALWHTNCDAVEEFYRQYGTCNCPSDTYCLLPGGREVNLGRWLEIQRSFKKNSRGNGTVVYSRNMPADREMRLQALVDEGKLKWDGQMTDKHRDWQAIPNALV